MFEFILLKKTRKWWSRFLFLIKMPNYSYLLAFLINFWLLREILCESFAWLSGSVDGVSRAVTSHDLAHVYIKYKL